MLLNNGVFLDTSLVSTLKWLWSQWQHNYERNLESILINWPNLDEKQAKNRDPLSRLATILFDFWSKPSFSLLSESNWPAGSSSMLFTLGSSCCIWPYHISWICLCCFCNLTFLVGIKTSLRPATLLKKRLWHRCFPVNFAKFLRALFLQNTSRRLLLKIEQTSCNKTAPLWKLLITFGFLWNLWRKKMSHIYHMNMMNARDLNVIFSKS